MLTLDEAKDLFNRGVLPYRALARTDRLRLRNDFVEWRLAVLGGRCPVCLKRLKADDADIDHQHPMDRARTSDGTVSYSGEQLRGYVREVIHHLCNIAVLRMELGYTPKRIPAHLVYWYRIAYARPDEPR